MRSLLRHRMGFPHRHDGQVKDDRKELQKLQASVQLSVSMHESGRDMLRTATRLDTQWKIIILGAQTCHNKSRQRFTVDWFESDVWSLEGESKFGAVFALYIMVRRMVYHGYEFCQWSKRWQILIILWLGMFISGELDRASDALDVMLHALKYYQAEPVTKHQQPNQFNINKLQLHCTMSRWLVASISFGS